MMHSELQLRTLCGCSLGALGSTRYFDASKVRHIAATVPRNEKKDVLAGVHKDRREFVVRIVEQAKMAAARLEVKHSDFLTPPVIEDALRTLGRLSDVGFLVSGGYPQAERCRLSLGHKEAFSSSILEDNVGYPGACAAIRIMGDFMTDPAMHGDFLGSILATGITREKVGDILVQGDTGAEAIIVPELISYLTTAVTQVRKTPVLCKMISLEDVHYQPPRVQIIKTVEASLRIDAVASAGFKISRSKLTDLISAGDVCVNWQEVVKNGFVIKPGDIISLNKRGRIKVGEISNTRKGKYSVELLRYL